MTLYLDTSVLSALFDTKNPERLEITKEFFASRTSDRLASLYVQAGAVAEAHSADAYHVAVAVTCRADVVVSWNFRHIVRRRTRDVVNMINTAENYPHIEIVAPGELL